MPSCPEEPSTIAMTLNEPLSSLIVLDDLSPYLNTALEPYTSKFPVLETHECPCRPTVIATPLLSRPTYASLESNVLLPLSSTSNPTSSFAIPFSELPSMLGSIISIPIFDPLFSNLS